MAKKKHGKTKAAKASARARRRKSPNFRGTRKSSMKKS